MEYLPWLPGHMSIPKIHVSWSYDYVYTRKSVMSNANFCEFNPLSLTHTILPWVTLIFIFDI